MVWALRFDHILQPILFAGFRRFRILIGICYEYWTRSEKSLYTVFSSVESRCRNWH